MFLRPVIQCEINGHIQPQINRVCIHNHRIVSVGKDLQDQVQSLSNSTKSGPKDEGKFVSSENAVH